MPRWSVASWSSNTWWTPRTSSWSSIWTGNGKVKSAFPALGNGGIAVREIPIVLSCFTRSPHFFIHPQSIATTWAPARTRYFKRPNVNFDPDRYETKQIFYPSKDGTKVPMFIVSQKGTEAGWK